MNSLGQDLRHALRLLRKSPGFTLVAVLTLALGVGGNTAIFSVVNAVLLRPLPMERAEELVRIYTLGRDGPMVCSPLDFRDLRERNRTFVDMMATNSDEVNLTGEGGEPERLRGVTVTAEFFKVLGVPAALGRTFASGEDMPGKSKVVVLSHGLWKRRFSADPSLVGKTILVDAEPFTVVGVAPPGFDFPDRAQLWVPVTWEKDYLNPENRSAHFLSAYGRLKPGVSVAQASADLASVAKALAQEYPKTNTGYSASVTPLRDALTGQVRSALWMILGAVAMVLLIACINLSNLLLARSVSREGEISVRLALGASRGRVIRQLLVECLLLALLGAGAGVAVASWTLDLVISVAPKNIPYLSEASIDGRVLAFTATLALLTTLLFGLAPALSATRVGLSRTLREEGHGGGGGQRNRARNTLVVVDLAIALVLLVGAGLLLKSFLRLSNVDPGFRTDHVLSFDLSLPSNGYGEGKPEVQNFYDTLLRNLRAMPGVKSVGATMQLPLTGRGMRSTIQDSLWPEPEPGAEPLANVRVVMPGYFESLRIPLVRGRLIEPSDGQPGVPKAVLVSEEAARRLWPGVDPLGRKVEIGINFGNGAFGGEVVGVVGSVRHQNLGKEPMPEVYVPYPQARANTMTVVVRSEGDPLRLMQPVREEVRALDANLPVAHIRTLEELASEDIAKPRFYLLLVCTFATLALVLAALGIYGVVSYAVGQRTRELGIRMALGADGKRVLGLVLGEYLKLSAIGVGAGLALALLLSRFLEGLLYDVPETDLSTYALVSVTLALVATLSSLVPARRATRIDPIVALKGD